MALAIALILLVIGTVVFHVASPWWFTPIASNWGMMDDTVVLTFWVTGAVFVAVNLFMAWCVVRYRHRKGGEQRAEYEPENRKLEWWLTILTSVGVAAMLAPGLFVWAKFVTVPKEAVEVEALGQQWTWTYRLPGEDGVLGATDSAFVTLSNPFGIDVADDKGRDDVLVDNPELHLPVDQPVKVLLRSKDVLHNFTVAEFRVKMDLVPGMVTFMWLTPTRTGAFDVLCQELCGVGHFAMRGRVVVDSAQDYAAWLAKQPTFAPARGAPGAGRRGRPGDVRDVHRLPRRKRRGQRDAERAQACRAARLVPRAPAQEFPPRHPRRCARGDGGRPDGAVRPDARRRRPSTTSSPTSGPCPTSRRARRSRATPSAAGDSIVTCANCHGTNGQGVWSTRAPGLANQSDWYLLRQMQNFRNGVRGRHAQDFYGAQMARIGQAMGDDQTTMDIVAYIGTLRGAPERVASAPEAAGAPAHTEH